MTNNKLQKYLNEKKEIDAFFEKVKILHVSKKYGDLQAIAEDITKKTTRQHKLFAKINREKIRQQNKKGGS